MDTKDDVTKDWSVEVEWKNKLVMNKQKDIEINIDDKESMMPFFYEGSPSSYDNSPNLTHNDIYISA